MFGKKAPTTKILKKEYECRQCHKVMCDIYVRPEDEDKFDDSMPCCWPCFLKLCEEASANTKPTNKKKKETK